MSAPNFPTGYPFDCPKRPEMKLGSLASLWIATHSSLPLLLHQLSDSREYELACLLHFTEGDVGDHVKEASCAMI